MSDSKIKIPYLPVQPRDQEEQMRLACLAYCIGQLGGTVRIPKEAITKLLTCPDEIQLSGDPKTQEFIVTVQNPPPPATKTPEDPNELSRRASKLDVGEE